MQCLNMVEGVLVGPSDHVFISCICLVHSFKAQRKVHVWPDEHHVSLYLVQTVADQHRRETHKQKCRVKKAELKCFCLLPVPMCNSSNTFFILFYLLQTRRWCLSALKRVWKWKQKLPAWCGEDVNEEIFLLTGIPGVYWKISWMNADNNMNSV